jgi:hypothetical protein
LALWTSYNTMADPSGPDNQSIFDLLNMSNAMFRASPQKDDSYRYYMCKPLKEIQFECKIIPQKDALTYLDASPSNAIMPIKKIYPQQMDALILSYVMEAPIRIVK